MRGAEDFFLCPSADMLIGRCLQVCFILWMICSVPWEWHGMTSQCVGLTRPICAKLHALSNQQENC